MIANSSSSSRQSSSVLSRQRERRRLLLVTATTGYQTKAFLDAATALGVDVRIASNRCHMLDDPWGDRAIPIRFEQPERAADVVLGELPDGFDAMLALGDRATLAAAHIASAFGASFNSIEAAENSRNKRRTRELLKRAGLPSPESALYSLDSEPRMAAVQTSFPCVLKPLVLSGSRGVIRADNVPEFIDAFERIRKLLLSPSVAELRDPDSRSIQVESFIPGSEFAIEGVLTAGELQVLAVCDKPDPLNGPFFEETIYVTPPRDRAMISRIHEPLTKAIAALGLTHGPVHAEVRVNDGGVYLLEVASRPIGGLCARMLRFCSATDRSQTISLEQLLIRHALGEEVRAWQRESSAAGVMMIPIPRRGILCGVEGIEAARQVSYIDDVEITAKLNEHLVPLPEGASYLGFIFARAETPIAVEAALRQAHSNLVFSISEALEIV